MIRLAVRCRAEDADRVLAELLEIVPGGVEEERGPEWAEFAVYGPPGELPEVPDLEAVAGPGRVEISSSEIPDDWADRWRDFHEPVVIGDGRLVVQPSWEEGSAKAPVQVVVDPGQAFGTGGHATTALCLELLLGLADRGEARGGLADLGTGSGVLAIAAAKLGWAPVMACDSEAAAVEAARANAEANGVEVEVERFNLRDRAGSEAETVVANLTAPLLRAVAGSLGPSTRTVVCSGLLAGEARAMRDLWAGIGFETEDERGAGDWAALLLRRPRSVARED